MTDKQVTTVLAALRHWQEVLAETRGKIKNPAWVPDKQYDFFEQDEPLTLEEIDQLCEELNCPRESEFVSPEEFILLIKALREANEAPIKYLRLAEKLSNYFNRVKK